MEGRSSADSIGQKTSWAFMWNMSSEIWILNYNRIKMFYRALDLYSTGLSSNLKGIDEIVDSIFRLDQLVQRSQKGEHLF